MSVTAATVRDMAIDRSNLNSVDLIDETLFLKKMSSLERRIFLLAARINPDFFEQTGTTNTRSSYTDSWDLKLSPANVASVTKIKVAAIAGNPESEVDDEVHIVGKGDELLEVDPSAYIAGKKVIGISGLGDDDSNMVTQLTIEYSELPPMVSSTDQSLRIPDEWVDLVVTPLASFLAFKDQRLEEVQLLNVEYEQNLILFVEHIQTFDATAVKTLRLLQSPSGGSVGA